jgi:hypothetical protein
MGCNCKVTESIIAVVIIVLAIWPTMLGAKWSMWLIVIAAVLLLLHSFKCKACAMPANSSMAKSSKKKK